MADIQTIESAEAANEVARAELITQQNDLFRTSWGMNPSVQGQIVMTQGVSAMSPEAFNAICVAVTTFNEFSGDNDPHGMRDFGTVTVLNQDVEVRVYWKIDLYDPSFCFGSDDCADPAKIRRVMTLLLPSEY